jgi:hypothetical protein
MCCCEESNERSSLIKGGNFLTNWVSIVFSKKKSVVNYDIQLFTTILGMHHLFIPHHHIISVESIPFCHFCLFTVLLHDISQCAFKPEIYIAACTLCHKHVNTG